MKKSILIISVISILGACKKEDPEVIVNEDSPSPHLIVEKKNTTCVTKLMANWTAPPQAIVKTDSLKSLFSERNVFFMDFWQDVYPGSSSEDLFNQVISSFGLSTTLPSFYTNMKENSTLYTLGDEDSIATAHDNAEVVLNSNYDMNISGDTVFLKTTTKFFKNVNGDFLLIPLMVLREIDESGVKKYKNLVVDYARSWTLPTVENMAYRLDSGYIQSGKEITNDFLLPKKAEWDDYDLTFALIMVKRVADKFEFVNSFTIPKRRLWESKR
jgi:hypothetical protein